MSQNMVRGIVGKKPASSGRRRKTNKASLKKAKPAVKGGGAKPVKVGIELTTLTHRVGNETFNKLNNLFSNLKNPESGPLMASAEWDNLKALADKFVGGGRWLPDPNIGMGSCCGVSWSMVYFIEDDVWGPDSISNCKVQICYPSGKKTFLAFERLINSEVKMRYGDLVYSVADADNTNARRVQFYERRTEAIGKLAGLVGRYFGFGKSVFVLDNECLGNGQVEVPETMRYQHPDVKQRFIQNACRTGRTNPSLVKLQPSLLEKVGVMNQGKRVYGLVPVPRLLIDNLYTYVAGRQRTEKLLRDVMKRAKLAVEQSRLVPVGMRGLVASKLAFLSLVYGNEMEADMYRTIVPGSVRINTIMRDAFSDSDRYWFLRRCAYAAGVVAMAESYRRGIRTTDVANSVVPLLGKVMSGLKLTLARPHWLIASAMGLFGLKSYFDAPSGNIMAVRSDIGELLAVFGEELLKRIHPSMPFIISMIEGYGNKRNYLLTAVMHVLTSQMPLSIGVGTHYVFNSLSKLDSNFLPPKKLKYYDACVDEYTLRENEPVHCENKLLMPDGHPVCGRLPCKEPRESIHFVAFGVEGVKVEVSRSCLCNERAAIMSRVTCVHNPDLPIWDVWWSQASRMEQVIEPEMKDWLQHLPTRARGQVENANVSVPTRNDLVIKAFVKREKRVSEVCGIATKLSFVPRLIQGRSVNVKVATGPFTWAYGKALARVYNLDGHYLYTGGRSAEEIGNFYDRIEHQYRGLGYEWKAIDCKRWDRTVGPRPMFLLKREYAKVGAGRDVLLTFANRHSKRYGVTQGGIRFVRTSQVSSGDGDTSAGNSRIHLVLLEACQCVKAAMVSGDDALVFTKNISGVEDCYRSGGFTPVVNIREIDFCSGLFYPTSSGTVLGPKIGRVLGKTFHSMYKSPNGDYMPWLRGVCLSMKMSCTFVPILRVLIPRLLELAGSGKVYREHSHQYKSLAVTSHEVCEETWSFMIERYDLDETDILAIESELQTAELGWTYNPALISIIERDL